MKIVHVCFSTGGGAGRATLHLHETLRKIGVDSQLVALVDKTGGNAFIHAAEGPVSKLIAKNMMRIDKLPNRLFRQEARTIWSNNWASSSTVDRVRDLEPDIVHLHWVGGGALPIRSFVRLPQPIVWTLHDMWPFTGGCHYSEGCRRFESQCQFCPLLSSAAAHDLSNRNWERKQSAWKSLEMTIVCPSRWMAEESRKSRLFSQNETVVIHNGIDLDTFRPHERRAARSALGLPLDKFLIAFGSLSVSDPRKGGKLLQDALRIFRSSVPEGTCELVTFGGGGIGDSGGSIPLQHVGYIDNDEQLALVYSAADVFCAPSIEENLATTAIEALACGTPVIAFKVGGFSDIVEHLNCGFLAVPFEPDSLAAGLQYVFSSRLSQNGDAELRNAARNRAECLFNSETVAQQHLELYRRLAGSR